MNNNKLYEVIRVNNEFQVKSHYISYRNCDYIHTNKLIGTPKIFKVNKLNKFINSTSDIICYSPNRTTYGFTTNKDLADCYCKKYNLILEMQFIDSRLEELFEEESYCTRQKQKLIEDYNKTVSAINYQKDMIDIRNISTKTNTLTKYSKRR